MGQLIVTAVLASLVVGGGAFIFWPDLSAKLPKRAAKKSKKVIQEEATKRDIYRKHYSSADELVEVANLMEQGMKRENAKERVLERADSIVELLSHSGQGEKIVTCPVCYHDNRIRAGIIRIDCRCNRGEFKQKLNQMGKDAGHQCYY